MSAFNWCHGPKCHESRTQDRVRGSKGSKVLRTRKVKRQRGVSMYGHGGGNIWNYFCSHNCFMNFAQKHPEQIIRIEPRTTPLETPIEDPTKTTDNHYYSGWNIVKRGVDTQTE
jgi:hypothetical protein